MIKHYYNKSIFLVLFVFLLSYNNKSLGHEHNIPDSLQNLLDLADHDTTRIRLFNELSDYYHINEPEKSLDLSGKALIIAKRRDYPQGEADADMHIAQVQMSLGNYTSASEYVYEALRIHESLEDKRGIAYDCNFIGLVNFHLGNYESALEYLYRAVKLNFELKDNKSLAKVYNTIGIVYAAMGNNQQAISLYNKALKLNKEIDHKDWISNNYGNLGDAYLKDNDPISLDYFRKKLVIKIELNSFYGIANSHLQIGRYFEQNNIYDSSLYYYETGYQYAKDIKSLPLQENLLQGLARAYNDVHQYGAATHYYEELLVVMDSLRTEQSVNTMAKLEMQYNFDKLIAEQDILRKEKENNYILIGGALVLIILLASVSFIGQRRKIRHVKLSQEHLELEKKHLSDQVEYKDKELTTNVMYQVKKNELLSCVVEKLKKSKYRFKKENHPIIEEITKDIQATLKEDIWEEFELRFKEVHRDFYENLHKEYGELTPNEKKLCAFIRLGLSTKEIATVTQQNPNTIEVARTRLRKKLRISNQEVNLVSFLSNY